jgi:hypothetical protein
MPQFGLQDNPGVDMQVLSLMLTLVVTATHSPAPPKVEPLRAFDVKGISPGIIFSEWLQKIGDVKYQCQSLSESPGHTVKTCSLTDEPKCTVIGAKSFCHDPPKFDTFAGNQVLFAYKFFDDSLWQIEIRGISPASFDDVVATMETKYGKATITKTDIQNRMGAHFEDGSAVWTGSNGIILYKKYADKLDLPSRLTVYSTDGWNAVKATVQQNSDKAKNDM